MLGMAEREKGREKEGKGREVPGESIPESKCCLETEL